MEFERYELRRMLLWCSRAARFGNLAVTNVKRAIETPYASCFELYLSLAVLDARAAARNALLAYEEIEMVEAAA